MDNNKLEETIIKESFQSVKEFLGKLVNPSLEEIGGIFKDKISFWRFKNQINISKKAKEFLESKGIEPKKIPIKIFIPIMENGSLEVDEVMQNKWAALLANAANSVNSEYIKPSYAEILKEISSLEAKLLDNLFDEVSQNSIEKRYMSFIEKEKTLNFYKITSNEFDMIADNLFRLNLCHPPIPDNEGSLAPFPLAYRTYDCFSFTPLGYHFVKVCRFE